MNTHPRSRFIDTNTMELFRELGIADAEAVTLGPPVPAPQKSFGIGLNYRNHAPEADMDLPDNPLVFTKFPSCIVGPNANVELRSDRCDYERKLVVVIGLGGKDIPVESAWDHVLGLTVGQDISDRAAQFSAKLVPSDLIFTATPEGVGAMNGNYLSDGDVITTTIDGIGTMTNRCVRVGDWR